MTKYRICISKDEVNFFWIVVDNSKRLIMNPTDEDLKETKIKYYDTTNICPICRKENSCNSELTEKSILYTGNACHIKNTGQVVCFRHWARNENMVHIIA